MPGLFRPGHLVSAETRLLCGPGAVLTSDPGCLVWQLEVAEDPVPVCPELVALLKRHLKEFGTGPGGRLFVTRTGPFGRVPLKAYCNPVHPKTSTRFWDKARREGPQQGAVRLTARAAVVRPQVRLCKPLAQFRRTGDSGGRVGRSQRQRAAQGLRLVHRR